MKELASESTSQVIEFVRRRAEAAFKLLHLFASIDVCMYVQTEVRVGVTLLEKLTNRHFFVRVLLHYLGHSHFKVLLRHVHTAFAQRKHARLSTHGLNSPKIKAQ